MLEKQTREILIIGSGEAGKFLAWTLAKAGRPADGDLTTVLPRFNRGTVFHRHCCGISRWWRRRR